MEDSDKTMALKKAYAEIILNTAKEAAERLMASEKKAERLKHDLISTKDEAIRLLLRFKQLIDAKTNEAEVSSSNQQKKIDELEAQLHEAEDIITDLRMDLKCVQHKLQEAKDDHEQSFSGQSTPENLSSLKDATSEPIVQISLNSASVTLTSSDMESSLLNHRHLENNCCNATKEIVQSYISHTKSCCAHSSYWASVLERNKEPELYWNGCTQRIRALERCFISRKLISSRSVDDQPSSLSKEKDVMKFPGEEMKRTNKIHALRRRRRQKAKSTLCRLRPGQHTKPCQASSGIPRSIENAKLDKDSSTLASSKADDLAARRSNCRKNGSMVMCKGKRNRKVKIKDVAASLTSRSGQLIEPFQSSVVPNCCSSSSHAFGADVKHGENHFKEAENETKVKSLPRLDPGLTLIKSNVDPISGLNNVISVKAMNNSGLFQDEVKGGMKLRNVSALVAQKDGTEEISTLPSEERGSNLVDVPLRFSDLKDAEASEVHCRSRAQVDSNTPLKYPFQRKRKRELLGEPEETIPQSINLRNNEGKKQNDSLEIQDSSFMNVSSRENRRLAQVARQLISLSAKQRW